MSEKITCRIEPADQSASVAGAASETGNAAAQSAPEPAASTRQSAPEPAPEPAAPAQRPCAFTRASRWLDETFPNSRNAVLGGACGLVVALLLFTIGVLKTLVIAILVVVGIACGQYLDGEPKIVRFIQNLMKKR